MIAGVAMTDSKLLLAGPFSDDIELSVVQRLPGWDCVERLGLLDRPAVSAIMGRSRAGLVLFHPCLNHVDAQPNKLFEYMAAGLPVVASDFPLWRELIEGRRCGLCVDPLNPNAIAAAIRWIFEHSEEAEVMGKRGREAVRRELNWENEADKLLALYDSLA